MRTGSLVSLNCFFSSFEVDGVICMNHRQRNGRKTITKLDLTHTHTARSFVGSVDKKRKKEIKKKPDAVNNVKAKRPGIYNETDERRTHGMGRQPQREQHHVRMNDIFPCFKKLYYCQLDVNSLII